MKETKQKAVTISVTYNEYLSILTAFGEYTSKCESCEDSEFVDACNHDREHLSSFQAKYKRAVIKQHGRDLVKKALKHAREVIK